MRGCLAVATSLARLRAAAASGTALNVWTTSGCGRLANCKRGLCNPSLRDTSSLTPPTSAPKRLGERGRGSAGSEAGSRKGFTSVATVTVENGEWRLGFSSCLCASSWKFTDLATVNHDDIGPMQEYDARVDSGVLRNDEHQRGAYIKPTAVEHTSTCAFGTELDR
jgi:hypothetical protein